MNSDMQAPVTVPQQVDIKLVLLFSFGSCHGEWMLTRTELLWQSRNGWWWGLTAAWSRLGSPVRCSTRTSTLSCRRGRLSTTWTGLCSGVISTGSASDGWTSTRKGQPSSFSWVRRLCIVQAFFGALFLCKMENVHLFLELTPMLRQMP